MRFLRIASLLLLALLLTAAATAHAECAWVLWSLEQKTKSVEEALREVRSGGRLQTNYATENWKRVDSFEALALCKKEAKIAAVRQFNSVKQSLGKSVSREERW